MAGIEALRLGVRMFNVHALGGPEMMARLVAEVDKYAPRGAPDRPLLLAVTILTSSTDATLRAVGIARPVTEIVITSYSIHYTKLYDSDPVTVSLAPPLTNSSRSGARSFSASVKKKFLSRIRPS